MFITVDLILYQPFLQTIITHFPTFCMPKYSLDTYLQIGQVFSKYQATIPIKIGENKL